MHTHQWQSEVKDSELDSLGIAHNANYFICCEHARHLYIKELGLTFTQLYNDGYSMVITKSEVAYKKPLIADDSFIVKTQYNPSRARLLIEQTINRPSDNAVIIKATFHGTGIHRETGKIGLPSQLVDMINQANTGAVL